MNIARLVVKEINDRLTFLNNVGLGYLTLARRAREDYLVEKLNVSV